MRVSKTLIRGTEELNEKDKILVCFPFAGGGASAYNGWKKNLDDIVGVCPVQLPGREDRIMEHPYQDMEQLIEDVVAELGKVEDEKIYLMGHSMGGKIAYEVAKKLEEKEKPVEMLMVSGSRVPHIPESNPIYHLPDSQFISELKRFEGMPEEIMENKELMNFFLPMLRADFEMDETYYTQDTVSLKCPIVALGGSLDAEANEEDISMWKDYTTGTFEYKIFEGGHFFIKQQEKEVMDFVREKIEGLDEIL